MISIIDNRNGNTVLKYLKNNLGKATKFRAAVAYLKQSGWNLIKKDAKLMIDNGGEFEIIVGLDFKITEPNTLFEFRELAHELPRFKLYCFADYNFKDIPTFHPKLYILENTKEYSAVIGSSNLTKGGLSTNYEINVILEGNKLEEQYKKIESIYNNIKTTDDKTDGIFEPDEEFLLNYNNCYKQINRGKDIPIEFKKEIVAPLKQRQKKLKKPFPTQKDLIVYAIKKLRTSDNDYISLSTLYEYVHNIAKALSIPFDYETLSNSIRARIYENMDGEGSDLFVRVGNPEERVGKYKLSQNGEQYDVLWIDELIRRNNIMGL